MSDADQNWCYRGCNIDHAVEHFAALVSAAAQADFCGVVLSNTDVVIITESIALSRRQLAQQLCFVDKGQSDFEFWQLCYAKTRFRNQLQQPICYKTQEK